MADGPNADQPDDGSADDSTPPNPLEALLNQLGLNTPGGLPGLGGTAGEQAGPAELNQLLAQMQQAFSMLGGNMFAQPTADPDSGVNWDVTKDTARKTVAGLGSDPSPDSGQRRELVEATSLAEVWLDGVTQFPRVSTVVQAWSRADWIERTMPVWRRLVEPVASQISKATANALKTESATDDPALAGLAGMQQMLTPMMHTWGASMFGLQLGQGLGQLATEVVGATDIGLPLSEPGQVALIPTNIAKFGSGLELSASDVRLYLALRECARQRLFAAVGWLREQLLTLVEEYARGITIDMSSLEDLVGRIDPQNMSDLSELTTQLESGGLFEPQKTPAQLATLERLETLLALVEGWVDEVVTQATIHRMPAATALAETVRRQRATGGPAEATFATLVGLELRPRRMRDAANLWAAVRDSREADGRDSIWSHPDLLPTARDLDDPLGFARLDPAGETDEDFDQALAALLAADSSDGSKPGQADPDQASPAEGHGSDSGPEATGQAD